MTLELFNHAAAKSPDAAKVWLEQLRRIPENMIQDLFEQLPSAEITPRAMQFALTILELNRQRLLETPTL